jgi:hypothetical protein
MEVNDFEIEVIWFFYIDLLVIEISFENIYIFFIFLHGKNIFLFSKSTEFRVINQEFS